MCVLSVHKDYFIVEKLVLNISGIQIFINNGVINFRYGNDECELKMEPQKTRKLTYSAEDVQR